MIYLKSALAGLLALVAVTVVLPILVIESLVLYIAIKTEGAVGWGPLTVDYHPTLPVVALMAVCFASGFFWEYRRLMHR